MNVYVNESRFDLALSDVKGNVQLTCDHHFSAFIPFALP